jgi:hypothetical protein
MTVFLDVNNDGINDFSFTADYDNKTDTVTALGSNMWLGTAGSSPGAPAPLTAGTEIGADSSAAYAFFGGTGILQQTEFVPETSSNKMKGPWPTNPGTAYLGLEFSAADGTHYGWAQISACTYDDTDTCDPSSTMTIYDWAYQTSVGVGIQAGSGTPEPSTLSLFALGAAGLAAFRLRRKKAA